MGAGFSSSGGIEIPEETSALLASFAGPATRAHSDPLWASLLASCDDAPLASIDPRRLERALRPTCVALCRHNRKTAHLTTLLLHAARLLRVVRVDQAETPTRAVNAVVFATALLKHLVEFGDDGAFAQACSSPPAEGGSTHTTTVMRTFLEAIVEAIARRDSPSKHCYVLHLVCARALTVVCATALSENVYEDADARGVTGANRTAKHPGFAALAKTCADTRADWVSNRASANATDALIAALASRVAERAAAPKPGDLFVGEASFFSAAGQPARGGEPQRKAPSLAARFASAFSFGGVVRGSSISADRDDLPHGATPLADACARLFLVLTTFPARANPFREAARACADETETRRTPNARGGTSETRTTNETLASRPNANARESLSKAARAAPNRVPVVVDHGALLETLSAFLASDARRYAAPLLHFLLTECDAFVSRARSRRGSGDAGERLDVTTLAPALISALDGFGTAQTTSDGASSGTTAPSRGGAASPSASRRLETPTAGDAFADEHAYAALPLTLVLASDEGFVEAARRRDFDGEPRFDGRGAAKTPETQTPLPRGASVLTALFGALARLARRGGFGGIGGASSDAASARAVFTRALTLGALANIAPRCAGVDAATASKLVSALDAFERRERAFGRRPGGATLEALAVGDLVCLTLEMFNSAVTHAASANPELVYALLHRRDLFEPRDSDDAYDGDGFGAAAVEEAGDEREDAPGKPFRASATRANLRGNLRRMLAHLDEKIEVTNAYVTAERVMEMAARAASSFEPEHVEGAVRFEPTPFAYASSPDAARTFFAPLAWRLVVEEEGFEWDERTITGGMLGRAVGEAL